LALLLGASFRPHLAATALAPSLALHLHQVGRRTFTSELLSMPSTQQNREVFAVPGSPLDPRAEGANGLLKQGAVLVTEAEDIVNVLRPILGQPPPEAQREEAPPAEPGDAPAPSARARIIALMGPTPVAID